MCGYPKDGHRTVAIPARPNGARTWSRRNDTYVVTGCRLRAGKRAHLSFDAAGSRRVTVRNMGDAHSGLRYATLEPVTTLAFVHAHPDDEALLTAGTMARAAALGHRVVLITATDGAAGLTSQEFAVDLVEHRQKELLRSAEVLHTAAVHTLGYRDSGLTGSAPGGFAQLPVVDAADSIRTIAESEAVDVLIGYDPAGGYGHPDHLQVHAATRAAHALLDPTVRLFEATLPREPIARVAAGAAALRLTPATFDPKEFARAWTPRNHITHRVNVRGYLHQKRESMRSHASQRVADDSVRTLAMLARLPAPVFAALLGTEYYVAVS